jgi:hypothetical protein
VQDGGLISYGPRITEMTRRSAMFVDKVLPPRRCGGDAYVARAVSAALATPRYVAISLKGHGHDPRTGVPLVLDLIRRQEAQPSLGSTLRRSGKRCFQFRRKNRSAAAGPVWQ